MRRLARAVLLLALGSVPAGLPAQDRDSTAVMPERPTVATHAYAIAPGYVEIETGATFFRPGDAGSTTIPFYAKLGVARWLQLGIGQGAAFDHGQDQSLDAFVGQYDVRGGARGRGTALADGDADVRKTNRGRIIGAVPDHRHHPTRAL